MLNAILKKIFGSANERKIRALREYVVKINSLEPTYAAMSDADLRAEIARFKQVVQEGVKDIADHQEMFKKEEEILMEILPPVFAVIREASKRVMGQRHYDVQLLGGILLHQGTISEMKTGEGKTLTSTLPLVLNALTGRGAHLVTVNEYLAARDAEWMGRIYKFLGLTVGITRHGQSSVEKKAAYGADITYGTNSEYGFDYLRDNMKYSISRMVQGAYLHFAIVDEVDSILIDEARTPLIISGPSEDATDKYYTIDKMVRRLKVEEHYTYDEKDRNASLTDDGVTEVEKLLSIENLYDPENIETLHLVNQSLVAHTLYERDREYILQPDEDGVMKVNIVDEFTGRVLAGRRWSDGLHQAIEAKEGVPIENENQTLASITYQNFFRMYDKLSGMTGTADTEAVEFKSIYDLDVVVVPTNMPMIRLDNSDVVYKTEKAKFEAIVEEIARLHKKGQPVLVGTVSVEKSELMHQLLTKAKLPHNMLNAKHHGSEAEIIANAGAKGAVTIATNMAGRGTDIILGGNAEFNAWKKVGHEAPLEEFNRVADELKAEYARNREEVTSLGGLYVLGTERHESRRIDNQLRGRSGRQGDPGESRFFISLEDDLMRLFGGDRLKAIMERLRIPDDMPIEHRMISNTIEKSQRKVEGRNFDIRKNLLEYDDVMNQQRTAIYTLRRTILRGEDDWLEDLKAKVETIVLKVCSGIDPKADVSEWPWESLNEQVRKYFNLSLNLGPDVFAQGEGETSVARLEELIYFAAEKVLLDKVEGAHRTILMDLTNRGRELMIQLAPDTTPSQWNWPAIATWARNTFNINTVMDAQRFPTREDLEAHLRKLAQQVADTSFGKQVRNLHLEILDKLWKNHLLAMDHLKDGISLRGYGQRDPKQEYKREGYANFEQLQWLITTELVEYIYKINVRAPTADEEKAAEERFRKLEEKMQLLSSARAAEGAKNAKPARPETVRRQVEKVGRNDPCPCGSGKKFKKCHWGQKGYEQFM